MLRDPLDRAALAGRVAPLEDDDEPGALGAHPLLEFHQLRLQPDSSRSYSARGSFRGLLPTPS